MSAVLVVDVGNTRVKWARAVAGELGAQESAVHADWNHDDWRSRLFGDGEVGRVIVASVAGPRARGALEAAAAQQGVSPPHFVASTGEACGVRNAYREPGLLGVDRWAALAGARGLVDARDLCIADVGTAATIDAMRADGTHLGGYILPGPRLMTGALLRGTSDLAAHSEASGEGAPAAFADNTREAIERGCRVALASAIERACADLGRLCGAEPALLVTGGAAAEVLPHVRLRVRHVPDLVLRGVLRLAGP